jgi:hypothetical protein
MGRGIKNLPNQFVFLAAALIICRLVLSDPDVDKWVAELKSNNAWARKAAAESLANVGDKSNRVVEALIAAAKPPPGNDEMFHDQAEASEFQTQAAKQAALAAQLAAQKLDPGNFKLLRMLIRVENLDHRPFGDEQGRAAFEHLSLNSPRLEKYRLYQMQEPDVSEALEGALGMINFQRSGAARRSNKLPAQYVPFLVEIGKKLDPRDPDWDEWNHFSDCVRAVSEKKQSPELAAILRTRVEAMMHDQVPIESKSYYEFLNSLARIQKKSKETLTLLGQFHKMQPKNSPLAKVLSEIEMIVQHGPSAEPAEPADSAATLSNPGTKLDIAVSYVENVIEKLRQGAATGLDARGFVRNFLELPEETRGEWIEEFANAIGDLPSPPARQFHEDVVLFLWERGDPKIQNLLLGIDPCRRNIAKLISEKRIRPMREP